MLERDQILTGGDAGPAVTHDAIGRGVSQHLLEIATQRVRVSKRAAFVDVSHEVIVHRARDMAWHAVDWLDVAAVTLGSSSVEQDRKSTRLNSSHLGISYAVFCLKKKKKKNTT